MNTISTSFKFLVENSNNPLLIFSHDGAVKYFNHSAEFLTSMHLSIKLFRLAVNYASQTFGSRTVYIDLTYGMDRFHAITVLYESDDELCLYLYRTPRATIPKDLSFNGFSPTDINLLLEVNIEFFKIRYRNKLTLFTDYSLPKFQMQQNSFSMLLQKLFEQFFNAKEINITLKIKIGETIIIKKKKYPIVMLEIKSNNRANESDKEIERLSLINHITAYFHRELVILEIPSIVSN
jgi:nitrogen-specific signal transduction histidine kinase